LRSRANRNRAAHVFKNQIREIHVLVTRAGFAAQFYRAAENLIHDAIGNGNVFRDAATETETRPARAEITICDGDKPATAEERARVVLTANIAIADVNMFRADEMQAVVVADDAAENADAVEKNVSTIANPNRVVFAVEKINVANP